MSAEDNQLNNDADQSIEEVPLFKKKRVIIPLVLLVIGVAAVVYWYIGTLQYASTDDAYIDANRMSISSKILGRIVKLTVDEGDSVKTGQLLVKLDSVDILAQINQAKTSLELSKESINLSKVNVDKAQEDFDRAQKQFKDKIIPKEQYDHAQKALEAAKAEYNISQSKITNADAQLNVLRTELENTSIFSPMNGVVAKRWVLTGDVVQPGQPVFTIYDQQNTWVTAQFEETKLGSIHLGSKVDISVDTYPDQQFEGEVYQIGTNTAAQFSLIPPSNASGNFTKVTQRVPVKITIHPVDVNGKEASAKPFNLLPGMSVEVKIKVK
ncbi:MAG: HlyD family secretion protein [Ignavibacteriaceae bacterium]|nr:HlyD family secretion protein [Ignavibacteriaceae bacterium]